MARTAATYTSDADRTATPKGTPLYLFLNAVSWALSICPAPIKIAFAKVLTFLAWDVLGIRKSLVLKNLKIAFGSEKTQDELQRIGRQSLYNFALNIIEFFSSYRGDLESHCEFVDTHNLKAAEKKGQGVYILCFHMGSWEAMGAAMSTHLVPTHVIVKKVGSESVNRFVSQTRLKNRFYFFERKKKGDAFRGILKVLKNKEAVGFAFDQARPGEPRLPFFGKPAKTNTSLAAIQLRAEAPIVPGYAIQHSPFKHKVYFLPEVVLEQPSENMTTEELILERSKQFNKIVESVVRKHPEHYFWMHNRWKD